MSTSVIALLTLAASVAQAQDATPPAAAQDTAAPAAAEDTVVVVTGIRNSLRSAMTTKKNATEIFDSIVANHPFRGNGETPRDVL